ncbi:MAG: amidohydrolase family protein [Deltaproteobacteria bacterium]|nr:amidohydrolase family protein [Deltaproteobacteria bacterium]
MASTTPATRSARIRAGLDHPIIDGDAHLTEFYPGFLEYIEKVGGGDFARRYRAGFSDDRTSGGVRGGDFAGWADQTWEERRRHRTRRPAWWGLPTRDLRDAATTASPGLLYERMEEFGWDYTIVYGGLGLYLPVEPEDEKRRIAVRALNALQADMFSEYSDRMTPVAVIPMHTPEEAIDELDYAVGQLGHKVIMIPAGIPRPIPALQETAPQAFPDAHWLDHFAVDSEHDYDPFFARCVELGVAVTSHAGTVPVVPWSGRSISSYSFNHIGNHAMHQAGLAKSLVMGGVTRRFPTLNFGLLEGGMGWGFQQLIEMVGLWEKRSVAGLAATDPSALDRKGYVDLVARYGGRLTKGKIDQFEQGLANYFSGSVEPADMDEWAAMEIETKEDFVDRYVERLFFGCEADDRATALAFDTRLTPFGVRFNATFGSDIGHFDVPDMTKVVEEMDELREEGLLSSQDFRDFVFANTVRLHGGMNPDFFKGTAVEAEAAKVLSGAT